MAILELPEILTAQHIANYLGISRGKIYSLFQAMPTAGGIPNFAVGTSKRVDKKDFLMWIEARKGEKAAATQDEGDYYQEGGTHE